jgi:hypothetical protein
MSIFGYVNVWNGGGEGRMMLCLGRVLMFRNWSGKGVLVTHELLECRSR